MSGNRHQTGLDLNPFRDREISYHGIKQYPDDWSVKRYGICVEDRAPAEILLRRADDITQRCIEQIDTPHEIYGVGVSIAHEANDGDFIVFFWWVGENMIASRAFYSEKGANEFYDVADSHITACVWELEIIQFERHCWIDNILKNAAQPNFDIYMNRSLVKRVDLNSTEYVTVQ